MLLKKDFIDLSIIWVWKLFGFPHFRSGSVCLDVINQTWSPMFGTKIHSSYIWHNSRMFLCFNVNLWINWWYVSDLVNVFEVFLPQLLLYPNPSDPLNGEAAALMMRDRTSYEQRVKGNYGTICLLAFVLLSSEIIHGKTSWLQYRTSSNGWEFLWDICEENLKLKKKQNKPKEIQPLWLVYKVCFWIFAFM